MPHSQIEKTIPDNRTNFLRAWLRSLRGVKQHEGICLKNTPNREDSLSQPKGILEGHCLSYQQRRSFNQFGAAISRLALAIPATQPLLELHLYQDQKRHLN
ncbi:conserved hypothetical protein [Ricinus communis]|uniref:Uncharacterized protein n=1 Tax=Ricinus communis TaxID=3988 RepID=B9RLT6_RICCO|nr:conserved hypothetical protein [Ricinus communis]